MAGVRNPSHEPLFIGNDRKVAFAPQAGQPRAKVDFPKAVIDQSSQLRPLAARQFVSEAAAAVKGYGRRPLALVAVG